MEALFGFIPIVIGLVLFYKGMSKQRLAQLIEDTPTSRTTDISSFGLCEIKGTIESDDLTETPGTGEPCVWYKVTVLQRVRGYSNGRRHDYWETVRDDEYGVTFQVRDAFGTFDVNPYGAQIDVPELPKADEGGLLGFLGVTSLLTDQKISVWSLTPGTEVYVLGEVQPNGKKNAIGRGEGAYPFVISIYEESELLKSTAAGAWGWMIGSAVTIIGGCLWIAMNVMK